MPLRPLQAKLFSAASIRKSEPEIKNHCTVEGVSRQKAASIRKSVYEIKNRCSLWAVSGENLASIRKSGPEIKSRCTQEGLNRENLASIPKSGLEIKNHFSSKSVLQAEPFSFAATKTGYVSNFKELLFYGVRARCNFYNFTEQLL